MRSIDITLSENSGTRDASVRHFTARLSTNGDLLISGIDDGHWLVCEAGSAVATSLAAILGPTDSRLDDRGLFSPAAFPLIGPHSN